MKERYDVVRFGQNGLVLGVTVSPKEETIWLNRNEMCLLFGRDKSVIAKRIRNIFTEGELDRNQVVAKN